MEIKRVWLGCRHGKTECGEESRFSKFVVLSSSRPNCRSHPYVDVVQGMSCEVILASKEDTKLPRTQSQLTRVWPL